MLRTTTPDDSNLAHRNRTIRALLLLTLSIITFVLWLPLSTAITPPPHQQVRQAWQHASVARGYHYHTQVVQTSTPTERLEHIGRHPTARQFAVEGAIDRRSETMILHLQPDGPDSAQVIDIKIEDGVAWGRTTRESAWTLLENPPDLFTTGGDPLGFLAAARNVRPFTDDTRSLFPTALLPDAYAATITRYTFDIHGPTFAAQMRDEMEHYLQQQGALPAGVRLSMAQQYVEMEGYGELWLDAEGLPLRQMVALDFPPAHGAPDQVAATITTDFTDWDMPPAALVASLWEQPGHLLHHASALASLTPTDIQHLGVTLSLSLLLVALAMLCITCFRSRRFYLVVVVAALISLLTTPLMQARQVSAFSQEQQARQHPASTPPHAADTPFDPHRAPRTTAALEPIPADPAQEGEGPLMQVGGSACPTPAEGTDCDGDGLDDLVELYELGTWIDEVDSDGDGISDGTEATGFDLSGKTWYLDPRNPDTNGDGVQDALECPQRADVLTDGTLDTAFTPGTCQDTDGNQTPDVFDYDNDGDGVPDSADSSPNSFQTVTNQEFGLTLANVATEKSIFVDVTVRPTNADHLFWTHNVLDWPQGDDAGQIMRVRDDTIDQDGDMMLSPMLEIAIPYDAANPSRGLPVLDGVDTTTIAADTALDTWLDQDTLDQYGIGATLDPDNGTIYAYVPLSLQQDDTGSTPVAWGGRMLYHLENGTSWGDVAHQMKVIWLVNAVVDMCEAPADADYDDYCDPDKPENWTSSSSVIQTYYEDFVLTGLTVREDHGVEAALFAQNSITTYEHYLWHLADTLQDTFLEGKLDGSQRLSVLDIEDKLTSWGIPGGALTVTELDSNTLPDQTALINTLNADTITTLLDSIYPTPGDGDTVTLLMAGEETYRSRAMGDDTSSFSSNVLTTDFASTTTDTLGILRWTPYTYNTVWADADLESYLDELEGTLSTALTSSELSDLVDGATIDDATTTRDGALLLALSYYTALYSGSSNQVAADGASISSIAITDADYALVGEVVGNIVEQLLETIQGYYTRLSLSDLGLTDANGDTLVANSVWALMGSSGPTTLMALGAVVAGTTSSAGADALLQLESLPSLSITETNADMGALIYTTTSSVSAMSDYVGGGTIGRMLSGSYSLGMVSFATYSAISWYKYWGKYKAAQGVIKTTDSLSDISKAFQTVNKISKVTKVWAVVGLALDVGMAGFTLYNALASGAVEVGSPAFGALLAEAIASVIVAVFIFALALIPGGQVFLAVLGLIDALMMAICAAVGVEAGSDVDRWVCSGVTGAIIQGIAYLIYQTTPLVDLDADDRLDLVFNSPTVKQLTDNTGFIVGNEVTFSATVNTSLSFDTPDDMGENYISSHFTDSKLDDSTFAYRFQTSESDFSVSFNAVAWEIPAGREDAADSYSIPPGVRFTKAFDPSLSLPMNEAGLNQSFDFYLSESFQTYAQNCWRILLVPYCELGDYSDTFHNEINSITLDVLPTTIDEFYTLASVENNSYRFAWDEQFPTLADADGDGLRSRAKNGTDPDDSTPDFDGDGLTDYWEYANNFAIDDKDADNDGLTDYWEAFHNTDPYLPDTDYDGLLDSEEVFHPNTDNAYDNSVGVTWSGGWEFIYGYASDGSALITRVTSNPLDPDTDDDGLLDKLEYIYGYNPRVESEVNVLNITDSVLQMPGTTPDAIKPGDSFTYAATVENNLQTNRYARGLFEAEFPSDTVVDDQTYTLLGQETTTLAGSVTVDPAAFPQTESVSMTMRAGAVIEDADTGRLLWLHMNEAANSTTFADDSLRGHDATCTAPGCPTANADYLDFDGSDDMLTVANDSDFDLESLPGISLSTWFYVPYDGGYPNETQTLMSKEDVFELTINPSTAQIVGTLNPDCTASWQITSDGSTALRRSRWNHVLLTYDENNLTLYVNGIASGSTTSKTATGVTTCNADTSDITIGAASSGSTAFNGYLDEVQIFDTGLTSDEANDLFKEPVFSFADTLFDESIFDVASLAISAPDLVDGMRGDGFSFDQTQELWIYDSWALDVGANDNTFSMAMWINPEDGYAPDDKHFQEQGQVVLGHPELGYEKAPPTLYVKDNEVMIRFGHDDAGDYCEAQTDADVLDLNSWQHIALSFEGDGFTLYKNGTQVANPNWQFTNGGSSTCFNQDPYPSSVYWMGHGQSTAVHFDSITWASDASDDKEVYLWKFDNPVMEFYAPWNRTGGEQVWYSGDNTLDANNTYAINEWVTFFVQQVNQTPSSKFVMCLHDDQFSPDPDADCNNQENSNMFDLVDKISWGNPLPQGTFDSFNTAFDLAWTILGNTTRWKGTLNYRTYDTGFKGTLDEVRLYNTALNADDVSDLYRSTFTTLEMDFDAPPGETIFTDSSGNGLEATCDRTSGLCPESGLPARDNQGLRFDGSDDYLTIPDDAVLDSSGDISIAAWVKPDTWNNDTMTPFVVKGNGSDGSVNYYFGKDDQNRLTFAYHDGTAWRSVSSNALTVTDGQWHHMAAVLSAGSTSMNVTFYLNGSNVGSSSTAVSALPPANDHALTIGRYLNASHAAFDGLLDDLVIERYALSAPDIQDLIAEAPVLNLHFDEDLNTTTFADDSTDANAATCTTGTCPEAGDDGQVRETAIFDGGDSLSVAASSALNRDTFSISTWVRPLNTRTTDQWLLQKADGSGGNRNYGLSIAADSLNLRFSLQEGCAGSLATLTSAASLLENQWNHVAATYDGTTMRLYINGTQDSTTTSASSVCTSNQPITIGSTLHGNLDELTIHGTALSDGEVAAMYDYQVAWYDVRYHHTVTVDADAPVVRLDHHTDTIAATEQLMAIYARDATSGIAEVRYQIDGGAWQDAVAGDTQLWFFTYDAITPGAHTVVVQATDGVGATTTADPVTITVDASGPDLSISSPADGSVLVPADSLTVEGSVSDAVSAVDSDTVSVALLDWNNLQSGAATPATVDTTTDTWQATLKPLPRYGRFTLRATAEDTVGNQSSTTSSVQFDSSGPVADVALASFVLSDTSRLLTGVANDAPQPFESTVLHLHFEEPAGATTFADSSRNHATVGCSGATCPTAGAAGAEGSAASFDGQDDALTIANDAQFETDTTTLMAWVNPTWSAGSNGYDPALLGMRDSSGTRYSWHISDDYTTLLLYNGTTTASVDVSLTPNQWYHLALVQQGDEWTAYVNGSAVGSVTQAMGDTEGLPLVVGAADGSSEHFTGSLDDVTLYKRALSASEVYYLANPLDVGVQQVQIRFRHVQERDQTESEGTWHTVTLDTPGARFTTWRYTFTEDMEAPYKIDLKTVDTLGNTRYLPAVWTGDIDTLAPRLTLTYALPADGSSPALAQCTAADFNLTTDGWECPVDGSHRTPGYQDATWFTSFFSGVQKLATLATSAQAAVGDQRTLSACDAVGNCDTVTIPTGPGGITAGLGIWLRADAGTTSTTDGTSITTWTEQSEQGWVATNTSNSAPTYTTDRLNFNPTLRFGESGTTSELSFGDKVVTTPASSSGMTIFAVVIPDAGDTSENNFFVDAGAYAGQGYGMGYSAGGYTGYTAGGNTIANSHSQGTAAALLTYQNTFGSGSTFFLNGAPVDTLNHTTPTTLDSSTLALASSHQSAAGPLTIGRQASDDGLTSDGGRSFRGELAEVIIYADSLSETERQRIESYLALKYGITLLDEGQPASYTRSGGAVVWDASANSAYHHDVAVIGRDDSAALEQRKSRSINDDAIVTIAHGTLDTPTALDQDGDFLVWGNNDAPLTTMQQPIGSAVYDRLERVWLVQETGTIGSTSVSFDLSGLGLPYDAALVALLIDDDGDFSDATMHTTGRTISGDVVSFSDVDFSSGQYFTLLVRGVPDLVLDLTVTPASGVAGNTVTYLLTFSNAGTGPATDVTIEQGIPAGITVLEVQTSGTGAIAHTASSATLERFTTAELAAGAGGSITIVAQIDTGVEMGAMLTSSATLATSTTESDRTNNSAEASLGIGSTPPVLAPLADQTITETHQLTFIAHASDSDLPAQTLTFSLVDAPEGASIDASSGIFTWTPTSAQGPGSYPFQVVVTDSAGMFDSQELTVTVLEPATEASAESTAETDTSDTGPDASDTGPDASDAGPDASDAGPDASDAGPDASNAESSDDMTTSDEDLPDLRITLQGPQQAAPGTTVHYQLSYHNQGNTTASGVQFGLMLPDGMQFSHAGSAAGWQAAATTLQAASSIAAEHPDYLLTAGEVAAGEQESITVAVTIAEEVPEGTELTLRAFASLTSGDNQQVIQSETTITTLVEHFRRYLPLIAHGGTRAATAPALPDLVGTIRVVREPGGEPLNGPLAAGEPVQVVVEIRNQGDAATDGGFWVDLYINPVAVPAVNQPWDDLCELFPCQGITWQVTEPLAAGDQITLTSTPGSYAEAQTVWHGAFVGGSSALALLVDSWNCAEDGQQCHGNGAVTEQDEQNNLVHLEGLQVTGSGGEER